MTHHPGIKYRPDIDGLRAIAVLAVFAFHLGAFRFARGGFVGVDVFFVISGYLITQIIDREVRAGTFKITTFYRRRALRILPAFLVMILGVAAASLILLPPIELVAVGKSMAAAAASGSNILFYLSPWGYFFNELSARPLLHTWSLGVEEQFYFLFPLLLIGGYRLGRRPLIFCLSALGLGSFIISTWLLRTSPNAAFFLLPARFWELMLGSLAALGLLRLPQSRKVRDAAGLLGSAMVLYSIKSIDGVDLPLYWAVLPCVGALLIILSSSADQPSLVGRALSFKPAVWVGLISYSLYLWHWPVIVFLHLGLEIPLTVATRLLILAIAFALATTSWLLVEQPFRHIPKVIKKPIVLRPALAAIVAVMAIGTVFSAAHGFPGRFSPEANKVASYLEPDPKPLFRAEHCFVAAPGDWFDWRSCLGADTGARRVILFGDSHAYDLWPGLKPDRKRLSLRQVTATYCVPLLHSYAIGKPFCADVIGRFFSEYLRAAHPKDTIVISERWQPEYLADVQPTIRALQKTGARVVLVGPVPEYDVALPRLAFSSVVRNDPAIIRRGQVPDLASLDVAVGRIAHQANAKYVSVLGSLCSKDGCRAYASAGIPLMYDTNHLTAEGSGLVSPLIVAAVDHAQ